MSFLRARIICLACIAAVPGAIYAQTKMADSVAIESKGKKAIVLVNEANSNAVKNPVKSMKLATEALDKSIADKDKSAQYQSYNTLGTLYFNIGNYSKAAEYFKLASDGFGETGDTKNKAYSDKYLAESNKYLLQIKDVAKNSADYDNGKYRSDPKKKSFSKKSESYLKAKAKSSDLNNDEKIDIYQELGDVSLENKDTAQALLYMDKAKTYTLNADDKTVLDNSERLSNGYVNAGQYSSNITFQNQVWQEGIKRGSSDIVGKATYNLGTTYIEAKKPDAAIPFLMQSISVADKAGNIEQKQKSIKELSRAYESSGQYEKALEVIKRYVHTLDSVKDLNQRSIEENLAINEEFLKQEQRIQKLIVTQKQKEADLHKQQQVLWSLGGVILLFGFLTYALFRNIRQKKKANMQIKLQSLRTQMNPHFIFNSLNSVNNFISKNDERSANKYLADFSKLMRTVLKNSDQDFVSLETEIQTLKIYLDLEHFRFGDKFNYTLVVADDIEPEQVEVPPMLIQPYIENAIWHGLRYKEEKGLLEIHFFTENDKLYCTVKDNGIGRKKSAELKTDHQKIYQSTGIKNTKERIELLNRLHKTTLKISISDMEENGQPAGTLVKISLPYILQTQEV